MKCQNPDCDNAISGIALSKHPRQRYCSRECATSVNRAKRRENGSFALFSKAGNEAQAAYKAQFGHVPGYEQRKAALQRVDRTNNRKRRTSM